MVKLNNSEASDLISDIVSRHKRKVRMPGGVTMSELAEECNISVSAAEAWLQKDEAAGILWSGKFFNQDTRRYERVWYSVDTPKPDPEEDASVNK